MIQTTYPKNRLISDKLFDGLPNHQPPSGWVPAFDHCAKHGRYQSTVWSRFGSNREIPMVCGKCCTEDDAANAGKKLRERQEQVLQFADIEQRFWGCSFENYLVQSEGQKDAKKACQQYAAGFHDHLAKGHGMILWGNPGTGKNHLATAITRSVLDRGLTAKHTTAHVIIQRIRDTWRKNSEETEGQVLVALAGLNLLVIDEIGRQTGGSEDEKRHIFNVIDLRWRNVKPTILISNQNPDGLKAFLGEAAADRIKGAEIVQFGWNSYRGKKEI